MVILSGSSGWLSVRFYLFVPEVAVFIGESDKTLVSLSFINVL